MDSDKIKKTIENWSKEIGPSVASKRMVMGDISLAMAAKLSYGRYEPRLGHDNALKLIKILKKHGVIDGAN